MIVFFNNKFCDDSEATILFRNRGMYYGEGIFETMRAYNGKVFAIEQHLQRLFSSAQYFSLPNSFSFSELKDIIYQLLQKNNLHDAIIRITFSGGEIQPKEHFSNEATNSILFIEAKEFYSTFSDDVSLEIANTPLAFKDELRKHKTTNYIRNITALRISGSEHFHTHEILFLDEHNFLLEGTRTNIFLVIGETIVTPSLECDILPGITRETVKELCRGEKIPFEERMIHFSALQLASEIFLTNSLAEIVPVSKTETRIFFQHPITDKLHQRYIKKVAEYCS